MQTKKQKSAQDIHDDIWQKIRSERQSFIKERGYKIYAKISIKKKLKLAFDFMDLGLELGLAEGTEIPLSYLRLWLKCNDKKLRI